MFKHWSKRTKVMGGVAAGLLVLAIGVGVYGFSTGKISSSASTPYEGKITGQISTANACKQPKGVELWTTSNVKIGYYKLDSTQRYQRFKFEGLVGGQSYKLAAGQTHCDSEPGYCKIAAKTVVASRIPDFVYLNNLPKAGDLNVMVYERTSGGNPYYSAGALVQLSTGVSKTTGSEWGADFSDVSIGTINITATKSGYNPATTSVSITGCDLNNAKLTLLKK